MIKDVQVVVFRLFHCARDPRSIGAKLHGRETPWEKVAQVEGK